MFSVAGVFVGTPMFKFSFSVKQGFKANFILHILFCLVIKADLGLLIKFEYTSGIGLTHLN